MKTAAFHSFGGPEMLEVVDVATPEAGPGQVRVRVAAAGVQAYDCAVRAGWTPPGATLTFPQTVGNDFAGVVDQVGADVTGIAVGDEVLGWALLSCYAEQLVVAVDQIVAKPTAMSWDAAGAFSASAQTAHTALQALRVGAGDTVLIHAAAGGVGTVAVQLARLWGATVVGTASLRNHDYLRSLGAVPTEYGHGLVERVQALAPGGVTAALDAIGGAALDASVKLVADPDRIGTLVDFDRVEQFGVRAIFSQRSRDRLAELVALYDRGELRIEVSGRYLLHRAADAHREMESGHVRGKIVINPS
ncbi:NADP-dependent oxidoreductase [Salinispora sp. H7-4]|uniref:NADP-dependent oxidoreductase n=1 Tax=Salinispora sp. H7-4 TaxID=2748321 RepID=UPI0015D189D7|nr:NADP-dependent oxidoreductase [Salinispora sp. H7-4]NYT95680.1 NADP-dependent oxidoreductase [Salinispora sp. H7-4]